MKKEMVLLGFAMLMPLEVETPWLPGEESGVFLTWWLLP